MAERHCSLREDEASAEEFGRTRRDYGPARVKILEVDSASNTVEFMANGVVVRCQWTRDNVMPKCPSTLNSSYSQLPQVGDEGKLYLSKSLVDEYTQRGTPLHVDVKWPETYNSPPEYRRLAIWPTALRLEGVELATGRAIRGTVNLLDPALAEPGQSISTSFQTLNLRLSQDGVFAFHAPWVTISELRRSIDLLRPERGEIRVREAHLMSTAREKAAAWEQIAEWQELLRGQTVQKNGDYQTARELLATLER